MAAGLQLKNYLTSKDPEAKVQYQQRWLSFMANDRQQIKSLVRLLIMGAELILFIIVGTTGIGY